MEPFIIIVFIIVVASIRIVKQYERGVVFTLGKYSHILEPGLRFIIPAIQICTKVDIREQAVDIP